MLGMIVFLVGNPSNQSVIAVVLNVQTHTITYWLLKVCEWMYNVMCVNIRDKLNFINEAVARATWPFLHFHPYACAIFMFLKSLARNAHNHYCTNY